MYKSKIQMYILSTDVKKKGGGGYNEPFKM